MKRIAMMAALAMMLTVVPVSAAEWKEGLGPQQPYAGVPEVDLTQTMGYIMLYPRDKMPAEHFCDTLNIYLPRTDIVRGTGQLHLYDDEGEVYAVAFEDESQVKISPLTEEEMNGLIWGGGTNISIKLPVSLELKKHYYVMMDAGCFTGTEGNVSSLAVNKEGAWVPVVNGDFGVEKLAYRKPAAPEAAAATDGTATTTPAASTGPSEATAISVNILPEANAGEGTQTTADASASGASGAATTTTGGMDAAAMSAASSSQAQGGSTAATTTTGGFDAAAMSAASSSQAQGGDSAPAATTTTGGFDAAAMSAASSSQAQGGDAASASAGTATGTETSEEELGEVTLRPVKGDVMTLNIVIGGEAVSAVVYSENGSVLFDRQEVRSSSPVTGQILDNDVSWGIVFLNADGDVLDVLSADF